MIRTRLLGVEAFSANCNRIMQTMSIQVADAVNAVGMDAQATAKRKAPVLTGNLRRNITFVPAKISRAFLSNRVKQITSEVWSNAPYSRYVEFGTHKMKAQPFMRPAQLKAAAMLRGRMQQLAMEIR